MVVSSHGVSTLRFARLGRVGFLASLGDADAPAGCTADAADNDDARQQPSALEAARAFSAPGPSHNSLRPASDSVTAARLSFAERHTEHAGSGNGRYP